jgi:hypothetical protein
MEFLLQTTHLLPKTDPFSLYRRSNEAGAASPALASPRCFASAAQGSHAIAGAPWSWQTINPEQFSNSGGD